MAKKCILKFQNLSNNNDSSFKLSPMTYCMIIDRDDRTTFIIRMGNSKNWKLLMPLNINEDSFAISKVS